MQITSNFSVLLSVYKNDDPALFNRALMSIFENTLKPNELVIVADGPLTDELWESINQYTSKGQLRLVRLASNVGLARALNAGLRTISTEYTIRADSDDFNHPIRFEKLIAKLHEGYDLVGSAIREVDKQGIFVAIRRCPLTEKNIKTFLKRRNPFNHMSVGYRTSSIISAGGYPDIHLKEDYALWATLLAKGCKVCNIDEVLVDATAGTDMFKRRGGLKYAAAEIDLQRHLVRNGLKSFARALIDGILRSSVFLAPNFLRHFLYLKYLRVQK